MKRKKYHQPAVRAHQARNRSRRMVTEAINTKIKLLKRIAYGLPKFAHIRARILMELASEMAFPP